MKAVVRQGGARQTRWIGIAWGCFLVVWFHQVPKMVAVAAAESTENNSTCYTALEFQTRVEESIKESYEGRKSLRGILEGVASVEECDNLVAELSPKLFESGDSGYSNTISAPKAYSGLTLSDLYAYHQRTPESGLYDNLLSLRERIRAKTEASLGLCPGTLVVDFTHVSQKTLGGRHRAHADNCVVTWEKERAHCDLTQPHPYAHRVAASIFFLNNGTAGNFRDGDFYWSDLTTGDPIETASPSPGRMTYFTSGVENLHGALPVAAPEASDCQSGEDDDDKECPMPRRLAIAMWYTTKDRPAERIPHLDGKSSPKKDSASSESKEGVTPVVTIPVKYAKSSLRVILSFHLMEQQHKPAQGTWKLIQTDEIPLGMLFRDHSGLVVVNLNRADAIVVERHQGGVGQQPSLFYRLQESLLIHSILDQLEELAFANPTDTLGDETSSETTNNRLLELVHPKAIEEARTILPARSE